MTPQKDPSQLKKRGRPSTYNPATYPKIAESMCRLGATNEDLAEVFKVNIDTIKEWRKIYAEFSTATKNGKEFYDGEACDSLFKRVKGYEYKEVEEIAIKGEGGEMKVSRKTVTRHMPPDTTACIFWLKNRMPRYFRDFKATEISTPPGRPLEVETKKNKIDVSKLPTEVLEQVQKCQDEGE